MHFGASIIRTGAKAKPGCSFQFVYMQPIRYTKAHDKLSLKNQISGVCNINHCQCTIRWQSDCRGLQIQIAGFCKFNAHLVATGFAGVWHLYNGESWLISPNSTDKDKRHSWAIDNAQSQRRSTQLLNWFAKTTILTPVQQ